MSEIKNDPGFVYDFDYMSTPKLLGRQTNTGSSTVNVQETAVDQIPNRDRNTKFRRIVYASQDETSLEQMQIIPEIVR